MQEVTGSSPVSPTKPLVGERPSMRVAAFQRPAAHAGNASTRLRARQDGMEGLDIAQSGGRRARVELKMQRRCGVRREGAGGGPRRGGAAHERR